MNESSPRSFLRIGPTDEAKEDRREVFAEAVECFRRRDEIEERTARQLLYLVIRRVRQAHREQTFGATRSELKGRLLMIQKTVSDLEKALRNDEAKEALEFVGATSQELEAELGRLKESPGEAIGKLNLSGRQGSDRAAHSFTFHARPLLATYLRRLFVACTGKEPSEKNDEFLRLLSLTWEFATGEPETRGWERHIRTAKRDLVVQGSEGSLSGEGPGTTAMFVSAYMEAGDIADQYQKAVKRRREPLRQSPETLQLA